MYEDEINRVAFADTSMVRELIRLLPRAFTADLNLGKLRRLPFTQIASGQPLPDMPWAIGLRSAAKPGGQDVLLTLVFQSRPEPYMALHAEWRVALVRRHLLGQRTLTNGQLPQVLPIVIYTGTRQWPALPSVKALTASGTEARTCLQPNCQPLLLDAAQLTVEDLRHNRAAALLALQRCDEQERLPSLVAALFEMLKLRGTRTLRGSLAQATMRMLCAKFGMKTTNCSQVLRLALRHMEEPEMLAERITQWCEEWQQRGRAEGIRHEQALLQRQARLRFGDATAQALSLLLVEMTDTERLAAIGEWIVGAETANDFLKRCAKLDDASA